MIGLVEMDGRKPCRPGGSLMDQKFGQMVGFESLPVLLAARGWRKIAPLFLAGFLLVCGQAGLAQRPEARPEPGIAKVGQAGTAAPDGPLRLAEDDSYQIGPGDLLDVRVYGRAELTREVRVTNQGTIRLPFLDEIKVACQTEAQLAQLIGERYRKYLRDPQVDVFVREYKSQPVSVIGSFMQPERFQLQRRVRLLELLTFAGGPGGNAGGVVHVIRGSAPDFCDPDSPVMELARAESGIQPVSTNGVAAQSTAEAAGRSEQLKGEQLNLDRTIAASQATIPVSVDHGDAKLVAYRLRDVLVGTPDSNPFIRPGDIISIPETDQIFVTGAVVKPGATPMRSRLTLVQALGIAGGFAPDAARSRVRIVRQDPGSKVHQEFVYNVDDIQRRKAEDIVLLPNDVVHVPSSLPKSMGRGVLSVSVNLLNTIPFLITR